MKIHSHEEGMRRVAAGMQYREEPQLVPEGKHYCKYCYRTHANWYDDLDHEDGIFVCGCCQHSSILNHADYERHVTAMEKILTDTQ